MTLDADEPTVQKMPSWSTASSRTCTRRRTTAFTRCFPGIGREAIEAGWAETHPVARMGLIPPTAVMLYAPRDEAELDVIEALVQASHAFARPT